MKILDNINAWLSAERKARRARKAAKKAAELVRESEAIVQAREGSGKMDAEVTIKWKPNKRENDKQRTHKY